MLIDLSAFSLFAYNASFTVNKWWYYSGPCLERPPLVHPKKRSHKAGGLSMEGWLLCYLANNCSLFWRKMHTCAQSKTFSAKINLSACLRPTVSSQKGWYLYIGIYKHSFTDLLQDKLIFPHLKWENCCFISGLLWSFCVVTGQVLQVVSQWR